MHFQPSQFSYGGSYGFLGLSKAQRRDRKMRTAAKRMEKYEKCIAKGKGSKCDKYKRRAEKKIARAKELDAKLAAKGKGRSLGERKERGVEAAPERKRGRRGAKKGNIMASIQSRGAGPSPEEMPVEDIEMAPAPAGGGVGLLLPAVGLLMVGGIGFFVWKRKQG